MKAMTWGVTGLLVLAPGVSAHAQTSEDDAAAEAVAALRELPREPEIAVATGAHAVQAREACRVIPNPTARAICSTTVGLAVALDIGIPTIIDWLTEDAEAMNRESREVFERLEALEKWQASADGKLDVIIELLRSR